MCGPMCGLCADDRADERAATMSWCGHCGKHERECDCPTSRPLAERDLEPCGSE